MSDECEYFTVEFHCLNSTQRRQVDELLCKHFKKGVADDDGPRMSAHSSLAIDQLWSSKP